MYVDGRKYHCTHHYWDSEDNEYQLCGTWEFEKGNGAPDQWHLKELEVEMFNGALCDPFGLDVTVTGDCFDAVKAEGPEIKMTEAGEV